MSCDPVTCSGSAHTCTLRWELLSATLMFMTSQDTTTLLSCLFSKYIFIQNLNAELPLEISRFNSDRLPFMILLCWLISVGCDQDDQYVPLWWEKDWKLNTESGWWNFHDHILAPGAGSHLSLLPGGQSELRLHYDITDHNDMWVSVLCSISQCDRRSFSDSALQQQKPSPSSEETDIKENIK